MSTETLETLGTKVDALRALVEELLRNRTRPTADGLVGSAYVAELFDCSVSSVRAGKAGTHQVRWSKRRPLKCSRNVAHAALARFEASRPRPRTGPTGSKARG